jgi:hypothetical protein
MPKAQFSLQPWKLHLFLDCHSFSRPAAGQSAIPPIDSQGAAPRSGQPSNALRHLLSSSLFVMPISSSRQPPFRALVLSSIQPPFRALVPSALHPFLVTRSFSGQVSHLTPFPDFREILTGGKTRVSTGAFLPPYILGRTARFSGPILQSPVGSGRSASLQRQAQATPALFEGQFPKHFSDEAQSKPPPPFSE